MTVPTSRRRQSSHGFVGPASMSETTITGGSGGDPLPHLRFSSRWKGLLRPAAHGIWKLRDGLSFEIIICTCLVALKLRSLRFHSPRLCRAAVFLIQTNVSLSLRPKLAIRFLSQPTQSLWVLVRFLSQPTQSLWVSVPELTTHACFAKSSR